MTFRMYMLFMSVATALSAGAWLFVMWSVNPFEATASGFVMFYLTLLMSLVGIFTIAGVGYRVLILRRTDVVSREVRISFRHAVFLSLIAVIALALSAAGWLHWWAVLALIATVSVVEYVFLVKEEARRT